MIHAKSVQAAALVALIVSLLVVGVVSHTPIRHVIQVVPGAIVLGLGGARRGWSRFAALAVFVFWLVIMTLIWLYLLGVARVITGTFSRVEVVLTIAIGVAAAVGIVAALCAAEPSRWPTRLLAFLAGAVLQVGLTFLSVQPMFATR
jgi:hypothetical protein